MKTGRLSLDAEHQVDTAELLRAEYQLDAAVLHAASQQTTLPLQHCAAPSHSTPQRQSAADHELQLIRQEREALHRERDLLVQQLDMLRSMHQTTQQQLTQAQQMLHEMQHRYDRLLEAPRQAPEPTAVSVGKSGSGDRGAMRRRIVALLQEHPEGLSPAQMRDHLGVAKRLAQTCLGMARDGLIRRVDTGRYVQGG